VLLSAYTPTFEILGAPLAPVIDFLGLPNAETVAPATIVGITEMYVPVLLVEGAARMARFSSLCSQSHSSFSFRVWDR
jgi:nucleoside recognition membrane protein YjiH